MSRYAASQGKGELARRRAGMGARRRKRSGLVAGAACALLAGCAPPLQEGGVIVVPGAEARMGALCRLRPGGASAAFCVAEDEEDLPPAPASSSNDSPGSVRGE